MKLFMGFALACFIGATLLRKHDLKTSVWMLSGLVLFASIGYYFFRQI